MAWQVAMRSTDDPCSPPLQLEFNQCGGFPLIAMGFLESLVYSYWEIPKWKFDLCTHHIWAWTELIPLVWPQYHLPSWPPPPNLPPQFSFHELRTPEHQNSCQSTLNPPRHAWVDGQSSLQAQEFSSVEFYSRNPPLLWILQRLQSSPPRTLLGNTTSHPLVDS